MWFPIKERSFLENIRNQISPGDLPTYGSDPDARVYRRLTSVQKQFGVQVLTQFLHWEYRILTALASDRAGESWWHGAIFQLVRAASQETVPKPTLDVLKTITTELKADEIRFKSAVAKATLQLSSYDTQILGLQAQGSVQEEIDNVLAVTANTARANRLVRAWHNTATGINLDDLIKLKNVATRFATQYGGVPDGGISLPGIWELELANWIENGL